MAIQTLHRIDRVDIPGASFQIINNSRHNYGIESMTERPAGHAHPMFRANMRQRPVLEFSTPQIATAINVVPVCGAGFVNGYSYLKRATQTGSASRATTVHKRCKITSGLIHWTQITLTHNGKGEIQLVETALYDGVNAPFVLSGGVALSGTLTCDEFFGSGPCRINGVEIPGVQEITIQSGVQLVQEGDASEEFDTFVGLEITEPTVTIQTKQATNWEDLGLSGIALDGTSGLEIWGRRYKNQESRVADGVAQHIYFQGLAGSAIPVDTNGDTNSPITDTLKIELISLADDVLPLLCTPDVVIS